jgi:hypothetical protein
VSSLALTSKTNITHCAVPLLNTYLPRIILNIMPYTSVSQTFFRAGTPKLIVHITRNPCPRKRGKKDYKETAASEQRSPIIFPTAGKKCSRHFDISICNCMRYLKEFCIYSSLSRGTPNDVL